MDQAVLTRRVFTQPFIVEECLGEMPSFDGSRQEIERMDSTDSWSRDKGSVDGSEGSGVQPLTSGMLMRSSLLHAREKQNFVRQLVQKNRTIKGGVLTPPMCLDSRQVSEAQSVPANHLRSGLERQLTTGSLDSESIVNAAPASVPSPRAMQEFLAKAVKDLEQRQVSQSEELMESLERLKQQCQETHQGLDELSRSIEAQSRQLVSIQAQDPIPGIGELQRAFQAQAAQLQAQGEQLGGLRPQETSHNLAEVRKAVEGLSRDMESVRGQDAALTQIRRTVESQAKEVDLLRGQDIAHCLSDFRRTLETHNRELESIRAQAREDSLLMKTVKATIEIYDKSSTQRTQEAVQASLELRKLVEESRDVGSARAQEALRSLEELGKRLDVQGTDLELRGEELGQQLAEARQLLAAQSIDAELLRAQVTASCAEISRALEQQGPLFAALRAQDPAQQLAEMRRAIELQAQALESLRSQEMHVTLRAVKESVETNDKIAAMRSQETHLKLDRLREAVAAHSRELEQIKTRDSQGNTDGLRDSLQAHGSTISDLVPRVQGLQLEVSQLREGAQAHSAGLAELGSQVLLQRQAFLDGHQQLLAGLATQAQLEDLRVQVQGLRAKEESQGHLSFVLKGENERFKAQVALLEQREKEHLAVIEGLEFERSQLAKLQTMIMGVVDCASPASKLAGGAGCGRGLHKYAHLHKKRASLAMAATVAVLVVSATARVIFHRRLSAAPAIMLAPQTSPPPLPLHQLQKLPDIFGQLGRALHGFAMWMPKSLGAAAVQGRQRHAGLGPRRKTVLREGPEATAR